MGNIRPTYIKRVAIELVERFPDRFTSDFDHNKKACSELALFQGKAMRNRVAGYVTRYRLQQETI